MNNQTGSGFGTQLAEIITATTVPPPWWMLLATGGIALFVALTQGVFRRANLVGLIAHEAGHAATSLLFGGRVFWIELSAGHDAGTTWSREAHGIPSVVTYFAGYSAPPLAGLGVAFLLAQGSAPTALFWAAVLLVLVLLVSRDLLTFTLVLSTGASLAAALWFLSPWWQTWIACALMWLLLAHSVTGLLELVKVRIWGSDSWDGDDAEGLYVETGVSEFLWILLWAGLLVWCWWAAVKIVWPL